MTAIRTVVHPTDFSEASAEAFVHALRIALASKAALYLLHVTDPRKVTNWNEFPHVRQTLARWGLMGENEPPDAVGRLGITINKLELGPPSPVGAITQFLKTHAADLVVLATAGREGVARWLHGSVAEDLARHVRAPTLFVPAKARGFVDPLRGEVHLRHVLIPIDHEPKPAAAINAVMGLTRGLTDELVEEHLLHVGKHPPQVQRHAEPGRPLPVALRRGDVVEAIIETANEWPVDLIGMPTAGHQGFLDAVRGSTTERVLRHAPCPVLAVPATA